MSSITFRPCVRQDVDQAIGLIYSSGPAAFNYVFSQAGVSQPLEFLRSAFLAGDSEFGFQQHIAIERNGVLVGVGAVRYACQQWGFTLSAFKHIWGSYSFLSVFPVMLRGLRTEAVIPPPKPDVGLLYHLGIAESERGQGLGKLLVEHLLEQIKQQGVHTATLDVAASNPRAHALYKRLGFTDVLTREGGLKSKFGEVVDHTLMHYPLA